MKSRSLKILICSSCYYFSDYLVISVIISARKRNWQCNWYSKLWRSRCFHLWKLTFWRRKSALLNCTMKGFQIMSNSSFVFLRCQYCPQEDCFSCGQRVKVLHANSKHIYRVERKEASSQGATVPNSLIVFKWMGFIKLFAKRLDESVCDSIRLYLWQHSQTSLKKWLVCRHVD